jgi:hypothetical protein
VPRSAKLTPKRDMGMTVGKFCAVPTRFRRPRLSHSNQSAPILSCWPLYYANKHSCEHLKPTIQQLRLFAIAKQHSGDS